MALKKHFGEKAFYLPTHSDLDFGDEFRNISSGQKLFKIVELMKSFDEPIILLDEWDANLDDKNRSELNKIIVELAKTKTIVEIVHRGEFNNVAD